MLTGALNLLEMLGAEGGAASSLGRGSGIGATLGKLLGDKPVQAFGDKQELGGALKQISDLKTSIANAHQSLSESREHHEMLEGVQMQFEQKYGFRDPVTSGHMATMQKEQIEHARQMQLQQQQMEGLQARAAVTIDPKLAQQEERRGWFRKAGLMAAGGQAVQSLGPSFLRSIPGVQGVTNLGGFGMGETNAKIANDMQNQAAGAVSNIAGTALTGASIGGPLGAGVGAVIASAGEIAKLPSRIKDWSEQLVESNRHLGRFNGDLAVANAQRDVRTLRRDMVSAAETGPEIAKLSHSLDDLKDVMRPLQNSVTNVLAQELREAVKTLTTVTPYIKVIADIIVKIPFTNSGWTKFGAQFGAGGNPLAGGGKPDGPTAADMRDLRNAIRRFQSEDPLIPRQVPKR